MNSKFDSRKLIRKSGELLSTHMIIVDQPERAGVESYYYNKCYEGLFISFIPYSQIVEIYEQNPHSFEFFASLYRNMKIDISISIESPEFFDRLVKIIEELPSAWKFDKKQREENKHSKDVMEEIYNTAKEAKPTTSLLMFAFEVGDASCRYYEVFVVAENQGCMNNKLDEINKIIEELSCDDNEDEYEDTIEIIMSRSELKWDFFKGNIENCTNIRTYYI